ncbi:Hydroxyacid oxidase 1 [Onygenales sp. PD_10]|nr:Hydroxyacid oxidase 1 [Onygenales sp. PD_10]
MANRPAKIDENVLTISDLEAEAAKVLPRSTNEYYNHGAGDMITLKDNEKAYDRYKFRPRVLKNVQHVDPSTTIFGVKTSFPFGFAPCAAHKLAHPDGECGVSRASAKHNVPLCLSTYATTLLEDVIKVGGSNPYIMQISLLRDPSVALGIIKRAEAAGYKAMFVTVDLPVLGNRLNEYRNDFSFPADLGFPNIVQDESVEPASNDRIAYDRTIEWTTVIPWLRQNTKMEIWLKGVYTAEDVQLAIDHKVDGVVISNHGGRQLDGVPSTLDVLRECAPVAANKIPLAIDGGIRRGSDIFKAIALGASFCFAGRVAIWGLAYKGEAGVDLALKILYNEFYNTMALAGCRTVEEINKSHITYLTETGLLAKL